MNKLFVILVSVIIQYGHSHVCNENNEHFESATDLDIQGFDFFNPEHQTFEDVESYLNRFHIWTLDNVHTQLLCQKICNWYVFLIINGSLLIIIFNNITTHISHMDGFVIILDKLL